MAVNQHIDWIFFYEKARLLMDGIGKGSCKMLAAFDTNVVVSDYKLNLAKAVEEEIEVLGRYSRSGTLFPGACF